MRELSRTYFVLWTRGLRGPEISVKRDRELNEYERRVKLSDPVELRPEHAGLSLSELAKIYLPPERQNAA